jgi:hypothetical protein
MKLFQKACENLRKVAAAHAEYTATRSAAWSKFKDEVKGYWEWSLFVVALTGAVAGLYSAWVYAFALAGFSPYVAVSGLAVLACTLMLKSERK